MGAKKSKKMDCLFRNRFRHPTKILSYNMHDFIEADARLPSSDKTNLVALSTRFVVWDKFSWLKYQNDFNKTIYQILFYNRMFSFIRIRDKGSGF